MTKKHYFIIGAVVAALVVAAAAWFCLRGSSDGYAQALPSDVTMVGRFNAKELFVENGIDLSDLKDLLFSSSIDDSGLDLSKTAYLFAFQSYYGAIIPLEDKDKFLEATKSYHGALENQRGMTWTSFDGSFLVVADDSKAMIVGPATLSQQQNLRNTLYECMTQDKGGNESKLFESLSMREEPVALASNLGAIPQEYIEKLGALPGGLKPSDLTLCTGLKAKKNKIMWGLNFVGESEKAKKYLDEVSAAFKPIDATLYATAPANPLFHLEAGINGEKLLELLRTNPEIRTKLLGMNMIFDLDMILKSIDGDFALSVGELKIGDVPVVLQAKVKDQKFMANVLSSWNKGASESAGVRFTSAPNGNYMCSYGGKSYLFGTKDNRLFVTNSEQYANASTSGNKVPDDMKDCCFYASLDFSVIGDMLPFLPKQLSGLQRLVFKSGSSNSLEITLMADEDTDILKSLIKK